LLTAYSEATTVKSLDIRDARVMAGLLMGGALPALLSSMTLTAVGRTAGLRLLRYGVSSERFPDFVRARSAQFTSAALILVPVVPWDSCSCLAWLR
jgi:hypothetical protein